jgi:alkylhydroperoxidase family enzyme
MANATAIELDQKTSLYDITNLEKMKTLGTHAPEAMRAFVAFDKAALAAGAIPVKYKELMALAVAFTTQCPYCIELHANKPESREPRTRKSLTRCSWRRRCARAGRSRTAPMR